MRKFTTYLISFAALALFVNAAIPMLPVSILPRIETAQAAQGGPSEFKVGIGDESCGSQQQEYGSALYTTPSGEDSGYVTDANGKDPDCAKIYLNPGNAGISGGSMYTNDFRIGIALSESENGCTDRKSAVSYTPWASEGGGDAFNRAVGSINAADCIWIHYQTRPIPNGSVRIINVQAGISVGSGPMRYTPWASQGGGWSAYSTSGGGDYTSARVVLNTQLNYKYNADFVSTTIPQNPPSSLTKNLPYTNQNIVMKNIPDVGAATAMPWISDQEVSSNTNRGVAHCYEWNPTSASETCTQTTVYTSSKFKLRRIDNNTAAVVTTAGDLPYRRTVVSQYGATQVWYEGQCYPTGGLGGGDIKAMNEDTDGRDFANLFGLIKEADARPIDPGDGGETCDPPYPSNPPVYNPSYISQDQPANVLTNQNATFDNLTVTGVQDGAYQLQYQMVNTESGELFGDPNASGNSNTIARINVRIGAWGLSCTATATTVSGQPVNFAVNATGTQPSSINVTMTNTPPPGPPNAVMSNSPLVLNSANSYAGVAVVTTTGLLPGTYPLVFTGSGSDGSTVNCNSNLIVVGGVTVTSNQSNLAIYQTPTMQFTVNGGTNATIPANTSATLSWTVTATNSGNVGVATGNWSGNDKQCTPGTYNQSTGSLAAGTYTYTLTCPGALGSWTAPQTVTVTASSPPEQPENVISSNSAACGSITVEWQRSATGVTPTAFKVYRRSSESNPWQQFGADVPYAGEPQKYVFSVTDNSPLNPAGSNYYSVVAVYNSTPSSYSIANPYPIVPQVCSSNISTSDKDVLSVAGRINKTFTPVQCSGTSEVASLPNNALFAPGDVITFQINVCNTGTQVLSGITVTDTYTNLSGLAVLPSNPPGCVTGSSVGASSVTFNVADVAAGNGVCAIRLTGIVTSPPNPSAAIYRFQNRGLITASGGISKEVYTPPYLFSVSGGVPDRNETAPQ